MQNQTFSYRAAAGWPHPLPTGLDGPSTLVLAFGAKRYGADGAALAELVAAFPQSLVVGCSTAGEIGSGVVDDDTVSVSVSRFEHTRLALAVTDVAGPEDSGAAGERLASQLQGAGLRAVFVLSEGLAVNGTPLVAGLARGLPEGIAITGGLAGDGSRFGSTWVLAGGVARSNQICAIGFYGERLDVGRGCAGGWLDFGPRRRITRSQGNVLYELDGRPALDLYKEYLGTQAAGLPGTALLFPLSIRRPGSVGRPLVRTILSIDEAQRSMTFAGDVPLGHEACLMRSTDEGLIGSAARAMTQATAGVARAAGGSLVVAVSCVGRRLMLGERTDEEVEAILDAAPNGANHVGFYSYGEIAPGLEGGASELHNQTLTVTVFAEH